MTKNLHEPVQKIVVLFHLVHESLLLAVVVYESAAEEGEDNGQG